MSLSNLKIEHDCGWTGNIIDIINNINICPKCNKFLTGKHPQWNKELILSVLELEEKTFITEQLEVITKQLETITKQIGILIELSPQK